MFMMFSKMSLSPLPHPSHPINSEDEDGYEDALAKSVQLEASMIFNSESAHEFNFETTFSDDGLISIKAAQLKLKGNNVQGDEKQEYANFEYTGLVENFEIVLSINERVKNRLGFDTVKIS